MPLAHTATSAIRTRPKRVRCLALLGEYLFSGSNDRLVKAWHCTAGSANRGPLQTLLGHSHWVRTLKAVPSRHKGGVDRLLSGGRELLLWRIEPLAEQWR